MGKLDSTPAFTNVQSGVPDRHPTETCISVDQNGDYIINLYLSTSSTEISVGAPLYATTIEVILYRGFTDNDTPNSGETILDTFNFVAQNSLTKDIDNTFYNCTDDGSGLVTRFNTLGIRKDSYDGDALSGTYLGAVY